MNRVAKLQCLGPFALFAAVFAAEAAAYGLALDPTSATLWYINLNLFSIFQRSYYLLGHFTHVPAAQLIFVATPILLMACYGLVRNRKLPLAIASNFSVVYAVLLIYSWNVGKTPAVMQASLSVVSIPSGPGFALLATLIVSSLASMFVSHLIYFRAVRAAS